MKPICIGILIGDSVSVNLTEVKDWSSEFSRRARHDHNMHPSVDWLKEIEKVQKEKEAAEDRLERRCRNRNGRVNWQKVEELGGLRGVDGCPVFPD